MSDAPLVMASGSLSGQQLGGLHLAARQLLDEEGAFRAGAAFPTTNARSLRATAAEGVSEPPIIALRAKPLLKCGHERILHPMHNTSQADCAWRPLPGMTFARDNICMSRNDPPPHYLRQWRKASGLSLQAVEEKAVALFSDRVLAEGEEIDLRKIGVSHSNLSRVENYKVPYNQRLLEVLAEVYGTDPASLIIRDPSDPDGLWSIYDQIKPEERTTALRVVEGALKGFKRTGTDG